MKNNSDHSRNYQNLKELHEAIYYCRQCKAHLGIEVTNIQPEWDPKRGRLKSHKWGMWIGQAPGKTEAKRALTKNNTNKPIAHKNETKKPIGGIAFSGDAGQRFIGWLMDAGFSEEECRINVYKTAVVKCYPDKWPPGRKTDRRPGIREIRLCQHFLLEQIRLIDPVVLIPMGKIAIQWFFPELEL
mgnify:FL=1